MSEPRKQLGFLAHRLVHLPACALRVHERLAGARNLALELRESRLELPLEIPLQDALQQPDLVADFFSLGHIGVCRATLFDRGDLFPELELALGRQRDEVTVLFDVVQPGIEVQLARDHAVDICRREAGLDLRQPLRIGVLAGIEHIAVDINAALPVVQIVGEVDKVAVVLEPFLKLVRGEQVEEVARFRTFRQLVQIPMPAGSTTRVVREQLLEHIAGLEQVDHAVKPIGFFVERFDRVQVVIGGLADRIELGHGIRNRQHRLLHGRIEQVSVLELHPRHQRPRIIFGFGIGPANTEQRLVRKRTGEAYPLQRAFCSIVLLVLQVRVAERQVRFVAQ